MQKNQFFVHPQGICESYTVGEGTKIWAYAHVLPEAEIGMDCNICDHVFIENKVKIGHRVTIKCGVQLWDGLLVEDDVFIGPNATFVNDIFPRSKQYQIEPLKTKICRGASVGANATILGGITIGELAMIGAGSVVTRSVPPRAVVVGNPAKIIGYVDTPKIESEVKIFSYSSHNSGKKIIPLNVGSSKLYKLDNYQDIRGNLSVIEFTQDLPFIPKRQFFVYGVPSNKVRGEHAHFVCEQFLIAVSGSLSVVVDDGFHSVEVKLDSQNVGLFLPKLTWGIQYNFSEDCVLAVFASHSYNPSDYIRNYQEFISIVKGK